MIKKAALMARVSSDEQAKGYSLGVQVDSLTKYCERNNIVISKVFKEDHSAKSFDRPEFIEFMKESASTIIEAIEKGDFRSVLSGTNFNKIFARPEATEDEMVDLLKQLAYFNFSKFKADYLCEDKFLESAYLIPKLGALTQELDKLWAVSLAPIRAAVHRLKEAQMEAGHGAVMRV